MLSAKAVRRLTYLADYLDKLPRRYWQHFDMRGVCDHPSSGGFAEHGIRPGTTITERQLKTMCGTAACAMGWAGTLPYFRRLGLRTIVNTHSGFVNGEDFRRIFDLYSNQEHFLFYSGWRHNPKQWAVKCRRFIERETRE